MKQKKITKTEKEGVNAIVFLQGFAGIKEAEDKALNGWRGMSPHEQQHTIKTYNLLKR